MAFSALNRKCGLICARSAFSSDLLDCRRSSCATRSCSWRRRCRRMFSSMNPKTPPSERSIARSSESTGRMPGSRSTPMRSCSPDTGLVRTTSCSVAASIGRPPTLTIISRRRSRRACASAAAINVCSSVAGCIAARTCLTASTGVNSRPSQMRSSQRSVRDISHGITIATGARATANIQGRAGPSGSCCSHGSVSARNTPSTITLNRISRRALDDQVVELEAVLEVDRGDHEVDRRALREAPEDLAE